MNALKANNTTEKVQQLQRKLYLAAKKNSKRKFHALYDKISRNRHPRGGMETSQGQSRGRWNRRNQPKRHRKLWSGKATWRNTSNLATRQLPA